MLAEMDGQRRLSIAFILLLSTPLGLTQVIDSPSNTTVCSGSPASFTCVINGTGPVVWLINGMNSSIVNGTQTINVLLSSESQLQSTLTTPTTGLPKITPIVCQYYDTSLILHSSSALLFLQGPPPAPTNITSVPINATSSMLTWGPPPPAIELQLFTYLVEVRDMGANIYNMTVRSLQTVVNLPHACDIFEASIVPACQNAVGTSNTTVELLGGPPAIISQVVVTFPLSSTNNVTVSIHQDGVCYYSVVALTGSKSFVFSYLPDTATVTLPPKYYYTLNIIAYNMYGNSTSTVPLSTFDVAGIASSTGSTTGLHCIFNNGSLAIGCLAWLTDPSSGTSFCIVIPRDTDSMVNTSVCPAPSNCSSLAQYTVQVYDIGGDGKVSIIPAVTNKSLSLVQDFCNQPSPTSFPLVVAAIIGGIIGGAIVGGVALIMMIGCIVYLSRRSRYKVNKVPENIVHVRSNLQAVNMYAMTHDHKDKKDPASSGYGYVAQRASTLY